jgi:hypothetical protein
MKMITQHNNIKIGSIELIHYFESEGLCLQQRRSLPWYSFLEACAGRRRPTVCAVRRLLTIAAPAAACFTPAVFDVVISRRESVNRLSNSSVSTEEAGMSKNDGGHAD